MILNVNPTRMELLHLKKRLQIAKRGHKLLKDKQDELLRQVMDLVKDIMEHRKRVEKELRTALARFSVVKGLAGSREVESALFIPSKRVGISVSQKNLMSVKVPEFHYKIEGEGVTYGLSFTSGEMDVSIMTLSDVIEDLLKLAEEEKKLELLADEIEKTRRRVNALEYVLIPDLEETIHFISMKLEEMERSAQTRLMKIKDIVRQH